MEDRTKFILKEILIGLSLIAFVGLILPAAGYLVLNKFYGLRPFVFIASGLSGVTSAFVTTYLIEFSKNSPSVKGVIKYSLLLYVVLLLIGLMMSTWNISLISIVEILYSSLFGVCMGFVFTFIIDLKKKIMNKQT